MINGPAKIDECGVCNGNGSSCQECIEEKTGNQPLIDQLAARMSLGNNQVLKRVVAHQVANKKKAAQLKKFIAETRRQKRRSPSAGVERDLEIPELCLELLCRAVRSGFTSGIQIRDIYPLRRIVELERQDRKEASIRPASQSASTERQATPRSHS